MPRSVKGLFVALLVGSVTACNCGANRLKPVDDPPDAQVPFDAGVPDAGEGDAGQPDAGEEPDAGPEDAGLPDAGVEDAGAPDAGVPDAGCGPEGSTCGAFSCAGEYVCQSGACVELPVADGTACADAGVCQAHGYCETGVCVQPPPGNCGMGDLQITVTWDNQGLDMELHLIRPGGHLNDNVGGSDCTWTTCIGSQPDWGVSGVTTDDPSKDVDNTGNFGPENIFLNSPEAGTYAVYVEHWGAGSPSSVEVTISIRGQQVFQKSISAFEAQHVWDVARIHWPAGTVTAGPGGVVDCTGAWRATTSGCDLMLP